jgi:UDP-N-acetylglucosamine--N-acetylmuramyl-(pentapeptide) pyrophosphoryl-undecaprenol N-acetylglucosamine transferase
LAALGFASDSPVVYVTGGARGAAPINQRIAALLPEILDHVQVLHQTGPATANPDAQWLTRLRDEMPPRVRNRYKIVEYVGEELPDIYAAADLIVGRAGAGTVAELAYVSRPSILIPLPGASGNEQEINARVLGQAGAAVVLLQEEASPARLRQEILAILADPSRCQAMAAAASSAARPDAARALADALLALGERHPSPRRR